MPTTQNWSTQQLAEFLTAVSACNDQGSTKRAGLEHAAEALEAEVSAVIENGSVTDAIGFPASRTPEAELVAASEPGMREVELNGLGTCSAHSVALGGGGDARLLLARQGGEGFGREEVQLLRGMARVLSLTLGTLALLERERAMRIHSEQETRARRDAEDRIRHQALHDALTGLPNRTLLLDRLRLALARAERTGAPVAVLFLDVDNFKRVNDSSSHRVGDLLLRELGARLSRVVRPSDTLARFGGDEFVLLCEDMSNERDAAEIAERVADALRRPFLLEGFEHFVTASVGIALGSRAGEDPEGLIRDADAAMYRAKDRGRNRYELFDAELRARTLARVQTERALRGAIDRGELRVFYQPIVRLDGGGLRGFEALLRWERPGRGMVGPSEFIAVAEESGLIVPVGEWALYEASRQAVRWRSLAAGAGWGDGVSVSVNLSARQLADERLVEMAAEVLEETGARPTDLALEVTESALMTDPDAAVESLDALRRLGMTVVLDDFGTGYSSLSYVQRLPIDQLKIDRSFVSRLDGEEGAAIVSAVLSMARELRLTAVAEGVETAAQADRLRALGCELAQGFHFARPLPAGAAERYSGGIRRYGRQNETIFSNAGAATAAP